MVLECIDGKLSHYEDKVETKFVCTLKMAVYITLNHKGVYSYREGEPHGVVE